MVPKITATFIRRRVEDSGKDQAPDYYVYEFTDIIDEEGIKYTDKWIKETKLMKAIPFKKGKSYHITLSDTRRHPFESINLPYPIEVSWDKEKVYMKGGNSIIKVDSDNKEKNLSVPFNKIMGISNYDTAAFNKFKKGLMTEELLLKMNSRGTYYRVYYYDPQDKRKHKGCWVHSNPDKENLILIQKETQAEIDSDLEAIKRHYVTKEIEKYFTIKTEILKPKKRKR